MIIWNKKTSKSKGFNLKGIKSPVIDNITSLALTEDRGKFLVAAIKGGTLLLYNRSKGGKKIVENCVKKKADIVAITNLTYLDNKFFLIQDS